MDFRKNKSVINNKDMSTFRHNRTAMFLTQFVILYITAKLFEAKLLVFKNS